MVAEVAGSVFSLTIGLTVDSSELLPSPNVVPVVCGSVLSLPVCTLTSQPIVVAAK